MEEFPKSLQVQYSLELHNQSQKIWISQSG